MKYSKIALAIHGGAGPDNEFIRANKKQYKDSLQRIANTGYRMLKKGEPAISVVRSVVSMLEDDPLFNAGRGSALNKDGDIEMDAAIMNGADLSAGGVALVTRARNPILLADQVRRHSSHLLLAGVGADNFAVQQHIPTVDCGYFVTEEQRRAWVENAIKQDHDPYAKSGGTVGAVALDQDGNLASTTSTGGTPGKAAGRIGDSCLIGAGCYADNATCAISGTGDGELLMKGLTGYSIAMMIDIRNMPIQEAAEQVIKNNKWEGDIGIIGIDGDGELAIYFNSQRMHRAWVDKYGKSEVHIY
ncbi:isoaspartyl peptidase/L-asparaginase family protein [Sphingobacterium paucimobilis]|uniref:Isoaspartyl peptidase n=1 Tax=Sphingobacterium paucimobilis HER1398 TaxID=1346330 RepID=U2J2U2_9SPHI|nr:isoaspartyl peptidase/L-asparaginase [Sphingobacterium paucimobilis]ERJ59289.1 hypothetical protein M472_10935 [Sphingobacterium paucimobilis HER1398]